MRACTGAHYRGHCQPFWLVISEPGLRCLIALPLLAARGFNPSTMSSRALLVILNEARTLDQLVDLDRWSSIGCREGTYYWNEAPFNNQIQPSLSTHLADLIQFVKRLCLVSYLNEENGTHRGVSLRGRRRPGADRRVQPSVRPLRSRSDRSFTSLKQGPSKGTWQTVRWGTKGSRLGEALRHVLIRDRTIGLLRRHLI
jgi:hypothetical protein